MPQGKTDIPRPTADEISRIWQRAHDRQAETGRDQWVIGSAQQTDRRLHLRAGEDDTLCGGAQWRHGQSRQQGRGGVSRGLSRPLFALRGALEGRGMSGESTDGTERLQAHCFAFDCDESFESVQEMIAVQGRGERSPRHFCDECFEKIREQNSRSLQADTDRRADQ